MSFGSYPALSLKEARELRDEARNLLARASIPHTERKRKRATPSSCWRANTRSGGLRPVADIASCPWRKVPADQLDTDRRVFQKDVFPVLRHLTIYDITRAHLLDIIGKVEKRGSLSVAEARDVVRNCSPTPRWRSRTCDDNPSKDLEVVALPRRQLTHNPFLRMPELPIMLQTLRKYPRPPGRRSWACGC